MQPAVLQCLFFLLWNVTAAKCALGSAVIVAPFWAMIIKPLLQRLCVPAKRKQQQQQQQHATPPPPPTVPSQTSGAAGQRTSASRKSSSPRRGGKASGARKNRHPGKSHVKRTHLLLRLLLQLLRRSCNRARLIRRPSRTRRLLRFFGRQSLPAGTVATVTFSWSGCMYGVRSGCGSHLLSWWRC
ncbi:hypothetical protein TcCL_NonESM09352 [Trypanosoma cruzi]|nr:hypothetical protein TcCL_NonESM09352 [Trypanosoma cruzi]